VIISDPEATRTDAEIIEALQRAWLLPKDGPIDPAVEAKFSLNASVNDEGKSVDRLSWEHHHLHRSIGSNYSAGEKQLLALCRALIKNSRVIVLVSEGRVIGRFVLLIYRIG
jgi:ATP-binding cassette, subfamily C (CFTR/MRP), member 1